MTFQTSLINSRKIKELVGEVETEKKWAEEKITGWTYKDWHWVLTDDFYEGDYNSFRNKIPSPSLSELALVLKMVGEKKGWPKEPMTLKIWRNKYTDLCNLWAGRIHLGEEEANRKVNEMLNNILNQ
mgnify:CR=1 FL=1